MMQTTNSKQLSTQANKAPKRNSERVSHLLKVFRPTRKVNSFLDIGCGNGEITTEIAKALQIKHVYGADVYEESLYQQQDKTVHVEYRQVINNKINIPDHSVDLITCFMSIHHFVDFKAMMTEICRILKPKGWLFIREHNVTSPELKCCLDEMHLKYPDHPGGEINYWERVALKTTLHKDYRLRHLCSSDYPPHMKNTQAIYHSLFIYSV